MTSRARTMAAGGGAALAMLLAACGAVAVSPASGRPDEASVAASVVNSPPPSRSPAAVVGEGEVWIAYQWLDDAGGDSVFLVREDGTGLHQLVPDLPGTEFHPAWSPDGSRIAFMRITPEDRHEIWLVDADGSEREMLFSCDLPCNSVRYPDWAPDGSAIYFAQDANAPTDGPPMTFMIGKVDLASREASVVLTREDGMTAEQPTISPDGLRVAYMRFRDVFDDSAGSAIFVADLEGGPETRITEWELFGASPDWTADGPIVFNSYGLDFFPVTGEAVNLYLVNADGADLRPLTEFGRNDTRATQPRVAPDGSGLAFTQVDGQGMGARRIAFFEFGAEEPKWLTPEPIDGTHPQLRPLPDG